MIRSTEIDASENTVGAMIKAIRERKVVPAGKTSLHQLF
jgi:hypothetical protein